MVGVVKGKVMTKKRDQYRGKLQPNQIFKPLAFETFGGWVVEAVLLLKRMTNIMLQSHGKIESKVRKFLVEKISPVMVILTP